MGYRRRLRRRRFSGTLLIALAWQRLGLEGHLKRVRVEGDSDYVKPSGGMRAEAPAAWSHACSDFQPLLLPMLIGALIYGAVPQSFLTDIAGPGKPLAVPIAALVGVPLYVRTEAALPIGLALTTAGVGIGPVLPSLSAGLAPASPKSALSERNPDGHRKGKPAVAAAGHQA